MWGDTSIPSTCVYLPSAFSREWVLILETSHNSHSETFQGEGGRASRGEGQIVVSDL